MRLKNGCISLVFCSISPQAIMEEWLMGVNFHKWKPRQRNNPKFIWENDILATNIVNDISKKILKETYFTAVQVRNNWKELTILCSLILSNGIKSFQFYVHLM